MTRATVIWAAAVMLLAGGCGLIGRSGDGVDDDRPRFPHKVHWEEEDLACTDCHRTSQKEDVAGMPGIRGCKLCHEDIDEELPPERRVAAFEVDGVAQWSTVTKLGGDLKFSHRTHYDEKIECKQCHGAVDATSVLDANALRVRKDDCLECHDEKKSSRDCAACHAEIRADEPPASHSPVWTRRHGDIVHAERTDEPRYRCSQCHAQSACDSCHLREPPASHSSLWRRRSHGIVAAFDRNKCATCHRADSCISCHETTRPVSHSPAWGDPMYLHCNGGCHIDASGAGCTTCHRSLPSHADAPTLTDLSPPPHPMPPGGLRCTACHNR